VAVRVKYPSTILTGLQFVLLQRLITESPYLTLSEDDQTTLATKEEATELAQVL
jgi:hypothetical protein